MKRWTAIHAFEQSKRWQTLSAALNERGATNEFVPWSGVLANFQDLHALDQFDHVRMSNTMAQQILKQVKVQSSWTTLLGVVDGMIKTEFGWWPLCALYESLVQTLISLGSGLETRGSVVIAGAGGSARIAVAAFFKMGFHNFLLTHQNEDEALRMIEETRRKLFGATIHWIPQDKIVLLPAESAVTVSCTARVEDQAILTELSYLNFLKRPGLLICLNLNKPESVLMLEAREVGVHTISGVEVAARSDVLWAKWAFQADLDLPSYLSKLHAALD